MSNIQGTPLLKRSVIDLMMGQMDTLLLGLKALVPWLHKGPGQNLPLCREAQAALGKSASLPASATHLCFVLPLVAEHSARFQIPLLGAMAMMLVVICIAVIVVVVLARKVMALAAHLSHGHPYSCHPGPSGCPSTQRDPDVIFPSALCAFFFLALVLPISAVIYALPLSLL